MSDGGISCDAIVLFLLQTRSVPSSILSILLLSDAEDPQRPLLA